MNRTNLLLASAFLMNLTIGSATTIVIDFEGVGDGTSAVGLYAAQGVSFSSGVILTSGAFGGSLNEIDFPPVAPGQNVFFNEANLTSLLFTQPILSFSGSFTYGGPVSIAFFDIANTLIASVTSANLTNIGSLGDPAAPPNEILEALNLTDAVRAEISVNNADFTLDNLTLNTSDGPIAVIPEPGSSLLLLLTVPAIYLTKRFRSL